MLLHLIFTTIIVITDSRLTFPNFYNYSSESLQRKRNLSLLWLLLLHMPRVNSRPKMHQYAMKLHPTQMTLQNASLTTTKPFTFTYRYTIRSLFANHTIFSCKKNTWCIIIVCSADLSERWNESTNWVRVMTYLVRPFFGVEWRRKTK